MQTRYSTALGFLTAASLLGGSAFAFAPTFSGDLPTVIITDKVSGAVMPNVYDPANAITQNLFRYPDALDLSSLVSAGPSATLSDVRFVFNEYKDINKDGLPDSASPETGTNRTLLIQDAAGGDNLAFATVGTPFPLTSADFATAPQVGLLDFRNIDFSPAGDYEDTTSLPFDNVGSALPVHTIGSEAPLTASGAQYRVVQVYINTNFSTQGPNFKTMSVITSVDGEDRLTTGVPGLTGPPETVIQASSTDFSNWELGGGGLLATIPASGSAYSQFPTGGNPGVFTGFSTVPVRDFPTDIVDADPFNSNPGVNRFTAPGTTSLTLNAANNAIGYIRFGKTVTANIAANSLLRFRVRLESATNTAASKDDFKFGMGSLKTGITNTLYIANTARAFDSFFGAVGPETKYYNPPAAPGADFDSYLIAEAADNTTAFPLFVDLQPTDTAAAATGNDIKVTQWSLSSFDLGANRANLTGKNVVLNRGNLTVPAVAAGEVLTPESGATNFTFGAVPATATAAGQTTGVGGTSNASLASALTMSGTATALTYNLIGANVPSGASTFYPDFRQFSFYTDIPWLDIDHPTGGHYRVTNGKMYIFDVWASTTTPTATDLPQMRLNSNFGSLDSDVTSHFIQDFAPFNTGVAIQSAPRAYSSVNAADLGSAITTTPGFITVEFLQPSLGTMSTNANVTIHRITATEYNAP